MVEDEAETPRANDLPGAISPIQNVRFVVHPIEDYPFGIADSRFPLKADRRSVPRFTNCDFIELREFNGDCFTPCRKKWKSASHLVICQAWGGFRAAWRERMAELALAKPRVAAGHVVHR